MVTTSEVKDRSGPGSGAGRQGESVALDDRIREILHEEVVARFRDQLSGMLASMKTTMIENFDEQYDALSETDAAIATAAATATRVGSGQVFQYQDFDNKKPLSFDGGVGPDHCHEEAV